MQTKQGSKKQASIDFLKEYGEMVLKIGRLETENNCLKVSLRDIAFGSFNDGKCAEIAQDALRRVEKP